MNELYDKLHIFHLIPDLFEEANLNELELKISESNKAINIYNNKHFILYLPLN